MRTVTPGNRRVSILAATLLSLSSMLALPRLADAQSAENLAVVINDNSPDSQRIGEYYVRRRGVPAANVIHIRTSTDETVSRQIYLGTIEAAVATMLTQRGLQDRV